MAAVTSAMRTMTTTTCAACVSALTSVDATQHEARLPQRVLLGERAIGG
jgi:hypothetical protein